jgi:dUTP pyrophosphatase
MITKILNTSEIKELGLPQYADSGSSGADLKSSEDVIVKAGERKLVKTGIKLALPKLIITKGTRIEREEEYRRVEDLYDISFEAQVRPRSGLALKKGITVLNTPGTIDESYRGEIGVIIFNTSNEDFEIKKGDKIAQLVLCPVMKFDFKIVESLDETERGNGGFGSTGV